MSDAQAQIERVTEDLDVPDDAVREEPLDGEEHGDPDRTREMSHSSFSRMRTGWRGDDRDRILDLEAVADQVIRERFLVAFSVQERIRRLVRTQAVDTASGELLSYTDGTPVWVKDELGAPAEDWELLNDRERESLLMTISTHMFEWELAAAAIWSDAMMAKGIWQEVFARGFTAMPSQQVSGKPTVTDKEHWGHKNSAEERYFALFRSGISRRAEGLVRAMVMLERRLERSLSR